MFDDTCQGIISSAAEKVFSNSLISRLIYEMLERPEQIIMLQCSKRIFEELVLLVHARASSKWFDFLYGDPIPSPRIPTYQDALKGLSLKDERYPSELNLNSLRKTYRNLEWMTFRKRTLNKGDWGFKIVFADTGLPELWIQSYRPRSGIIPFPFKDHKFAVVGKYTKFVLKSICLEAHRSPSTRRDGNYKSAHVPDSEIGVQLLLFGREMTEEGKSFLGNVTSLSLNHWMLPSTTLVELISAMPELRHVDFSVHATPRQMKRTSVHPIHLVYQALQKSCKNLYSLDSEFYCPQGVSCVDVLTLHGLESRLSRFVTRLDISEADLSQAQVRSLRRHESSRSKRWNTSTIKAIHINYWSEISPKQAATVLHDILPSDVMVTMGDLDSMPWIDLRYRWDDDWKDSSWGDDYPDYRQESDDEDEESVDQAYEDHVHREFKTLRSLAGCPGTLKS